MLLNVFVNKLVVTQHSKPFIYPVVFKCILYINIQNRNNIKHTICSPMFVTSGCKYWEQRSLQIYIPCAARCCINRFGPSACQGGCSITTRTLAT